MKDNRTFVRFLALMGKGLPLFLFAMVIHMVGDNFLYLTLSYFVKRLTDMAMAGSTNGLGILIVRCVGINLCALLVFFIFGAIYDIYAKRGNAMIQRLMIHKVLRLPMGYFDQHHSGEIVSKLMNDADTASQIFTSRLRRVTTPLASVIVYLIPMMILCPQLTLCILGINLITLFINSRYIPKMKNVGKQMSVAKSIFTVNLIDLIRGKDYFKIFSGIDILKKNYEQANEDCATMTKNYWKNITRLESYNTFFDLICAVGFFMISLLFIKQGWCTVGNVTAIYVLYGTFSGNFLELGKYIPELMNCIARAEIVFHFLGEDEEDEEKAQENNVHVEAQVEENNQENEGDKKTKNNVETANVTSFEQEDICFHNVTFSYGNTNVLQNFSCRVASDESTAITGHTGCGKSTLIKLLLGFYNLDQGKITIGDRDIRGIGRKRMREAIAYVPQNGYLFHDTIMENIRYGNPKASYEDIVEAAKLANAHEFIMKLPHGYKTIVAAGGADLSGGERQRVSLARAFVKDAPIIVMDEATSALDNLNEEQIQSVIANSMKGKTALIIAHRKLTIDSCKNRIVME